MLFFIVVIIICAVYFYFVPVKSNVLKNSKDIVLFVIAHPDDECMFFAPTIHNLLRKGFRIYLLCLSAGGFYKKNAVRKQELRESCKILGIPLQNVIIVEHSLLPDNPDIIWNEIRVALIIKRYFTQLSAKIIFSFDNYGVSGHRNHIAIYKSLEYLKMKNLLPKDSWLFLLKSVYLPQKYLAFLSIPFCRLHSDLCFVSSLRDVQKTWFSMKAHASQFVWFRKLYIVFSRYVYMNTFTELTVDDKIK